MTTVLTNTCLLSGIWNMNRMLSSPTHRDPKNPFAGTNFWNAMTIPNIGMTENTMRSSVPGRSIKW